MSDTVFVVALLTVGSDPPLLRSLQLDPPFVLCCHWWVSVPPPLDVGETVKVAIESWTMVTFAGVGTVGMPFTVRVPEVLLSIAVVAFKVLVTMQRYCEVL